MVFYIHEPYGQSLLKDGSKEYHILYDEQEHFCTYTYKNVTSTDFMEDVYEYIQEHFENKLIEHGIDRSYCEDSMEQYIWIHLAESVAVKDITDISECLEKQFETSWRLQQIPTLLTLVKQQLNKKKVLAYAVSDYQKRHGVVETQNALHILFNHMCY